jgi:hypothetical protein
MSRIFNTYQELIQFLRTVDNSAQIWFKTHENGDFELGIKQVASATKNSRS